MCSPSRRAFHDGSRTGYPRPREASLADSAIPATHPVTGGPSARRAPPRLICAPIVKIGRLVRAALYRMICVPSPRGKRASLSQSRIAESA